jgi:hypothetical protein
LFSKHGGKAHAAYRGIEIGRAKFVKIHHLPRHGVAESKENKMRRYIRFKRIENETYHFTIYLFIVWRVSFELTQHHPERCKPCCGDHSYFHLRYICRGGACTELFAIPLWK